MASIQDSIRRSIDEWMQGEFDFAMLHACNAIDGTARKLFPALPNKLRFTRTLRENYLVLEPMSFPGIDINETRWPVALRNPTAKDGYPDIADVIYGVHRCCHGHGDELPEGFELISNVNGPARYTCLLIRQGKLRISDRTIFGLLGVAVFSHVNENLRVPDSYILTFAGRELIINEWWGRKTDFLALAEQENRPSIKLDFGDWMKTPKSF